VLVLFLPEFLSQGQFQYFVEVVKSRLKPLSDLSEPKLLVITSAEICADPNCQTLFDITAITQLPNILYELLVVKYPRLEMMVVDSLISGSGKSALVRVLSGDMASEYFIDENHQGLAPAKKVMHFQFSRGAFERDRVLGDALRLPVLWRVLPL
jgi:hypothetical protein